MDNTVYAAKVEGDSMQPVLNPKESNYSDFVLLNRWSLRRKSFCRGDIVVLSSPRDPSQVLIKRIIALEGDTVKMRISPGSFQIIPEGHCWVEGDHRERSLDSNVFGPVPLGLIFAKATHVIWPHNRWQRLSNYFDNSRIIPRMNPIYIDEDD